MPCSYTSKFFFTYILKSEKNNNLYFGYTTDIEKRLEKHNQGKVISTKPYAPWKLIYYEACLDKNDALRRERYLKTTIGKRMIKKRLRNFLSI